MIAGTTDSGTLVVYEGGCEVWRRAALRHATLQHSCGCAVAVSSNVKAGSRSAPGPATPGVDT